MSSAKLKLLHLLICFLLTPKGDFLSGKNIKFAIRGGNFSLQCYFQQEAVVLWKLNDKVIAYSVDGVGVGVGLNNRLNHEVDDNSSILAVTRAQFNDAGNYTCFIYPSGNGVAKTTQYTLQVFGHLSLSIDKNVTDEDNILIANCCIQCTSTDYIRFEWFLNKDKIKEMRILREDFGNQSRTCTRAMITVNRSYNGKSLGCQVEQYTSLNTSLPVYVSWKEERGLNDQATNNRWKAIIACVTFIVLLTMSLIAKIAITDGRCNSGSVMDPSVPGRSLATSVSNECDDSKPYENIHQSKPQISSSEPYQSLQPQLQQKPLYTPLKMD
ncbi:uncharacterized protein [Apostichopus japonicus]|uniref:uncharacterized protein isoform X2 n=1 Tax=Stichopus japonicus TaxID=307972 RepID=UPI003AB85081